MHPVDLDLALPTEEKELITDYEMKFIDRNYLHKKSLETEGRYVEPKAESL